jgi:opacity protein-like surface antigen
MTVQESGVSGMKKKLVLAIFLILASALVVSASEGDQSTSATQHGQTISTGQPPATDALGDILLPTFLDYKDKDSRTMLAQAEADDLSHQALVAAVDEKNMFYFVTTGGTIPLLDRTFREFLSYGGSVSIGVGQKIDKNLSLSVSLGVTMLTGDWSINGDRKSVEVASEEWNPGAFGQPGQTTITAESLPAANLGTGYSSGGVYQITSSESLKQIDVHTDFYIFPVTLNAIYKFDQIGNISPYLGGGLGYCVATRHSDSKDITNKYFAGPDYLITLNNSQTVNGMLLQLLGGISVPIYNKLKFVAEGNTTWYDLKTFDPILQISIATTPNPPNIGGNDVITYSYQSPKHVGVFSEVFVANFAVGLVMPF